MEDAPMYRLLPLQMLRLTEPNLAGLPLMEESHVLLVFQVQH